MSLEHSPQRGQGVAVPMSKAAYSITEFCALTGIGRTKAYAEIAAGRLHAKKVGSRTLITAESGKNWLDSLPDFKPSHCPNIQPEAA